MESVYAWCSTLCAVLIIASIVRIISPSEKTMKTLSLVIGLFVILAVASPLVSFAKNLDFKSTSEDYFSLENELSKEYKDEVMKETGDYLAAYSMELIKNSDLDVNNLEVIMEINEDGGISISKCRIYMDKDNSAKEKDVKELISTTLMVEPSILYE